MLVDKSFAIGQVVYVLSGKDQTIIPAMIIEEATIQTLSGKKVSWKLAIGKGQTQKIVDFNQINGEVHTNLDEIKKLLLERLTKFIDSTINKAASLENAWYGEQIKQAKLSSESSTQSKKIDTESLLDGVEVPDGDYFTGPANLDKDQARRKIREMVQSDEVDSDLNSSTFVDENGVKIRVHLPE